jgi:thioredoxin-dependent peroxiredoxin
MNALVIGRTAPEFKLKDKDGKEWSLKDLNTDYTVVYFYPKDNTPGCTIEANMFTRDLDKFKHVNTSVVGISGGNEQTKSKFCEKHDLKVLLLSDPDFKVAEAYGVYGEKKFMGRIFLGLSRITFVLDKEKRVIKVYNQVKPANHSEEILEFINSQ